MSSPVLHMPSGSPALPQLGIYAVDATQSREHAWHIARDLQAKMFIKAGTVGALALQLVYFQGTVCKASRWATSGEELARWMSTIKCEAGMTQIARVLRHALREHAKAPVQGMTYIGDSQEESLDLLAGLAGELGAANLPIHFFQEGNEDTVRKAFRLLALRSGGTYSTFNPAVPETIERLSARLNEVAHVAVASVAAIGTNRK